MNLVVVGSTLTAATIFTLTFTCTFGSHDIWVDVSETCNTNFKAIAKSGLCSIVVHHFHHHVGICIVQRVLENSAKIACIFYAFFECVRCAHFKNLLPFMRTCCVACGLQPHTHTHTVQQRLSLHVSVGFCRTEAPLGILTAITTSHWQPIQITTTTTSSPTTTTYIYNDKIMKIKAKNAEFSKNFWTRYEIFSISRVTNTKRVFLWATKGMEIEKRAHAMDSGQMNPSMKHLIPKEIPNQMSVWTHFICGIWCL